MTGRERTELSYVGAEPWLASLISEDRERRHLVAVAPDGEIVASMTLHVSELERSYLLLPPRDH